MTAYLGIDQSYSGFGVAVYYHPTEIYQTYRWAWPAKKFRSDGHRLSVIRSDFQWRLYQLRKADQLLAATAMEGYSYGSVQGREKAGELGGIVKECLFDTAEGEPWGTPTIVPPPTLKLFATGNGKASKEEMIEGVAKKWGPRFTDDNLADAYALARYAAAQYGEESGVGAFSPKAA